MSCTNLNCSNLPDHTINDCDEYLLGGTDQLILLDCNSAVTDPSSAAQINAAIAAGTAVLIQNVKFGIDAPSPIDIDSPVSCQVPKTANYDRSATLMDANVNATTVTFYDSICAGRNIAGIIAYMCGEGTPTTRFINPPAGLYAKGGYTSPNTDNDFQRFEITFTWRDLNNPSVETAPTGIFS